MRSFLIKMPKDSGYRNAKLLCFAVALALGLLVTGSTITLAANETISAQSAAPPLTTTTDPPISTTFYQGGEIDFSAATNGTYIINPQLLVFSMQGALQPSLGNIYCGGSNPLPICKDTGGIVDARIFYDPVGQRWIHVGMWNWGSQQPRQLTIGISKSNDPYGGWYAYQSPICGKNDVQDGSDQPHTGFNNLWIVVGSACTTSLGGQSLQIFNKADLYNGIAPQLGVDQFSFHDTLTNDDGRVDNPVTTYTNSTNVEYLTHMQVASDGNPQVVYSAISGSANAPVLTSNVRTVTVTGYQYAGNARPNAPGCSSCLGALDNAWIHSSGVYTLSDGHLWLLSSFVMGWQGHAATNIADYIATDLTAGMSHALTIGGDGIGMMANSIGAPLQNTGDTTYIFAAYSSANFYPGLMYYPWHVDTNTVGTGVSYQGKFTPCDFFSSNRWLDFIDSVAPTPNSPNVLMSGPIARQTLEFPDGERSRIYLNVPASSFPPLPPSSFVPPPHPCITSPAPQGTVAGIVPITAGVTDAAGTPMAKVEFYVDGALKGTSTAVPYSYSWNTNTLTVGSQHSLSIKAYDTAGRVGNFPGAIGGTPFTVTIAAPPPPPPGSPTITAASFTPVMVASGKALNVSITVKNGTTSALPSQGPNPGFIYHEGETFNSDGYGATGGNYRVGVDFDARSGIDHPYRWGLGSSLAPGASVTVTGQIILNTVSTKNYWAGLVDEGVGWLQDNQGKTSIAVTNGVSDTTPPSIPTGLAASPFSSSQINLAWTASTDPDSGVQGYKVSRNGTQIMTPTATSYADTGLVPNTTYSYTVSAYDPTGNTSAPSGSVSATTRALAKFQIGQHVKVTTRLKVRRTPSISGITLGYQNIGAKGTIVRGPVSSPNGFGGIVNWWYVNYDKGYDGWSVEGGLVSTP